jgi:1-deoxypentalenic acid 11beta-hydroxylase
MPISQESKFSEHAPLTADPVESESGVEVVPTAVVDVSSPTTTRTTYGTLKRGFVEGPVLSMHDSTALLTDAEALKLALARDGYALLRNVLDRDQILDARRVVLQTLDTAFGIVDREPPFSLMDGALKEGEGGVCLTGYEAATHHEDVLKVIEGSTLAGLFQGIFDDRAPATYNQKWVRVQGRDEFTDEHSDFYRFHNMKEMYVCWIPLGDYAPTDGGLSVCEQSHVLTQKHIESGVQADSKRELPPDFHQKSVQLSLPWVGAEYKMGDVVIFDIRTVHSGLSNTSDRVRLSIDTRWVPATNVPSSSAMMFKTLA